MQEQIDICLNCTKPRCTGTCKLIEDKELNISIYGELKYSESININTSTFSPKLS
jgi:hypothetical protein